MKRKAIVALLAAIFAAFTVFAVCAAFDIRRVWGDSAVCSIGSTGKELSLLAALYPDIEWTAYAQSAPMSIMSDERPSRTAQASVLSFIGKPERIAFMPLISGRLPMDGEADVCAVDANTAFELFKCTDAEGNFIRLDGKALRVVGVMDVKRPLVLIPADKSAVPDRIAADDRDALHALGFEPDAFELSGAELARFLWILCGVPWLLLAVYTIARLKRRGGWRRIVAAALFWTLSLGVVLALLWCVPVRLLPTRWSALGFYGEQIKAFSARPIRMPDIRDVSLKADALHAVLWCGIALITERMWQRCVKSR